MEDHHEIFGKFKEDFPKSGASRHEFALETHIMKAKETGVTDDEIKHALLLLIQTTGFPTFMEAYSVFNKM